MAEPVHPLKLVSLLLQYPTAELREAAAAALEEPIEPARRGQAKRLREFCRWYADRPVAELERLYVEAFDFSKQSSLHLTYHVHGDRRQRGVAMLELKRAIRDAGFEPPEDELPDFLPLLLEFAAIAPGDAGIRLLEDQRIGLELLRRGLEDASSPFEAPLAAALAGLGRLSAPKLARMRRLVAEGPPTEEVGLEPFAPPEVMPVAGPDQARPLVGPWDAR